MMGRVQQLCQQTIDWYVEQHLLPAYTTLGRFVPEGGSRGALSFNREEQLILHYAPNRGALYQDTRAWKQAQSLVAAFLLEEADHRPWQIGEPFAPFADLEPPVLLEKVSFALTRLGLSEQARSDGLGLATYRLEEQCLVLDLPEPYGKWCQSHQRARWDQPVNLGLEVNCTVRSIVYAGEPPRYAAKLELELSAPAAPLVENLRAELEKLFRPLPLSLAGERAKQTLQQTLRNSAADWLSQQR